MGSGDHPPGHRGRAPCPEPRLGDDFYAVPADAERSEEVAAETFAPIGPIVDVQTRAVVTSGSGEQLSRNLFNHEMAAARTLLGGAGGGGRLLNHAVVHADSAEEVRRMTEWREELRPVGWKVYTPGRTSPNG
jgi:hypothetical protein